MTAFCPVIHLCRTVRALHWRRNPLPARRGHPKLRLFSLSDLAHSPKR